MLIVIKGAGDLATGIACRLKRCGFQVVCTDIAKPTTVRCTVAFSRAVYDGTATVTGVTARLARDAEDARRILGAGEIPILIDPEYKEAKKLQPAVLVDAIIAKRISAPNHRCTAGGGHRAGLYLRRGLSFLRGEQPRA